MAQTLFTACLLCLVLNCHCSTLQPNIGRRSLTHTKCSTIVEEETRTSDSSESQEEVDCSPSQVFFNHACIKCRSKIKNCAACTVDKGKVVCEECASGYALTNGACNAAISHTIDPTEETICAPNATLVSGDCIECSVATGITGCATCTTEGETSTCLSCAAGYGATVGNVVFDCFNCDVLLAGCAVCSEVDPGPGIIPQCDTCAASGKPPSLGPICP